MISVSPAMFNDGQPILIRECEFTAAQLEEIINRTGIDDKLKDEKCGDNTNMVVAKLDTHVSSILEQTLLGAKDKNNLCKVPSKKVQFEGSNPELEIKEGVSGNDQQFLSLVVMRKRKSTSKDEVKDESDKVARVSACKASKTSQNSSTALCSMCGKKFSSNYNLRRHMNCCKLCPEYDKGPRFHCQCGRSYSQEWDMKKHKVSCKDNGKKCKKCLFPECNLLFYHRAQLVTHMKKVHGVSIQDPEVLEFESMDEFRLWKEREEEETYSYYSKQTGANVTGVSVNTYYVCQHDGSDRTHGSTPRKTERRNKKGRVKTGRLCWSQMNVKEFWDGTVKVTYYPSHTHSVSAADTEHHPLPSSIHSEIKRRLSEIKPDNEDAQAEYSEFKKPRKRSYGMNLRTLRSLARKNRKLFRITAEAVDDVDVDHFKRESKEVVMEHENNVALTQSSTLKHVVDQPEPQEPDVIETCSSYLQQIKTLLDFGKLSRDFITQVESALSDVLKTCQDEVARTNGATVPICELTEVMYQPEAISSNAFALGKESLELDTIDKTVYQVVTLEPKEEPASPPTQDLLYQNSMELVGPREFIIIANADMCQPVVAAVTAENSHLLKH